MSTTDQDYRGGVLTSKPINEDHDGRCLMCERHADEIDRLTKREAELVKATQRQLTEFTAMLSAAEMTDNIPLQGWIRAQMSMLRAALKEQP